MKFRMSPILTTASTVLWLYETTKGLWAAWHMCTPQKKKSLPVRRHGQAQGVMSLAAHHHKNSTKQEVLQVALMQIYDGLENPPKLLERRSAQTVGELVRQADALSEKEHAQGYPRNTYIVYNNDGERVYQRW